MSLLRSSSSEASCAHSQHTSGVAGITSTTLPFHLRTPLLTSETTLLRPLGRFGGPALRGRRGNCLGEQPGHPFPSGLAVGELRTMLGGCDREHAIDEAVGEAFHRTFPQGFRNRRRAGEAEGQFDPRVRCVDALPARTGGPREALGELERRDRPAAGDGQVCLHTSQHASRCFGRSCGCTSLVGTPRLPFELADRRLKHGNLPVTALTGRFPCFESQPRVTGLGASRRRRRAPGRRGRMACG
ncbi:hypothetical protein SAMN05216215_103123 [Saccharopolyspora shandongensis]|uniref:Uncharacterized protein n=1 Tax=Saccharopolyspora shandongensis TaxID=418495 RepID=A0A1H3LF31_9PSEU|nr:hypothetical protein SAMN05216215_103123 [Saccharopolyspora shandongensis]